MTASWDHEALWLKAKLFLNRAMDTEPARSFEEQALWASLALELLAKSALARVSPVLIAVPTEEGNSLLVASGLVQGDVRFKSVQAKTVYARCSKAFKPLSEKEAGAITESRNEYLHGAAPAFTHMPPEAWWPRFWAQAQILVNACDSELEDLVGGDRVSVVEAHLTQNKQNIAHRVEMLIERARQRLAQFESGQMRAKEAQEWARPVDLTAGLKHSAEEPCPACGALGLLEGEDIDEATPHYEQVAEDDYDFWVEVTVGSSYFGCQKCRLVLDSYELVVAAELPDTFSAIGEPDDYREDEYGND